jgi:N-acetylglucosaminyldiphosphoundecaprenol N-acetyl-beta-D-mannosaminyltransferase
VSLPAPRAVLVLGVPVDDVTFDETIDLVFALVADGRATGRMHQIATVNVDFVVNAVRDPSVAAIMRRTSLSIPDGMPVVWGARLEGTPLRTRVAGADLVAAIVERAATTGAKVHLYGAAPGVADAAAALLRERHPTAVVTSDAGPVIPDVDALDPAAVEPLRAAAPDICCVAFGNPKQERFIARFGAELGIPVMIGVGGSLDFLVGEQRRAPEWMQRSGLEWLYRAGTEPRRLAGRYARDAFVFGPRLLGEVWRGFRGRRRGSLRIEERDDLTTLDLSALERADNTAAAEITTALRTAARAGRRVAVVPPSRGGALEPIPGLAALVAELGGRQ